MAKPINHDLGSSVATGAWEAAKGAAIGVAALPLAGAVVGALATGLLISSGVGALFVGAMLGFGGGTALAVAGGAPLAGLMAAVGGLLGLGHGANKISNEKVEYQKRVMNEQRFNDEQRSVATNQGLQQGYQVGFQEGQQFAVQQIQQELQQQAMMQQQQPQQQPQQQQLPSDGFAAKEMARRGGHQHAGHADMVKHQQEQAAGAAQEI